jgi:hypothetical protein
MLGDRLSPAGEQDMPDMIIIFIASGMKKWNQYCRGAYLI